MSLQGIPMIWLQPKTLDLYLSKRKSENMFNKLKSNESDFSSLQHDPFLDIMNKNILYLTHSIDKCLLVLKKLEVDSGLQKQVDEYFEETSPQTDSDEQPSKQNNEVKDGRRYSS